VRVKLDRAAIARALRAHTNYLREVLDAESVRQDVKDAALRNVRVQTVSASELEERAGIRCERVFPKPSLIPGL
jgi:hypothetical protein